MADPVTWGAIIKVAAGAATAAYSANQAKKATNKMTNNDLTKAIKRGIFESQPTGLELLGKGRDYIDQAGDYWSTIAGGDMKAIEEMLGPELAAMGDQSAAQQRAITELSPRGGMSAALAAQNPMAAQAAQGNAILGARPGAIGNLATLGSNAVGLGNSTITGTGSTGLGLLNYGMNANMFGYNTGQQLGQSLASMFSGMDWSKLFGTQTKNAPQRKGGMNGDPWAF